MTQNSYIVYASIGKLGGVHFYLSIGKIYVKTCRTRCYNLTRNVINFETIVNKHSTSRRSWSNGEWIPSYIQGCFGNLIILKRYIFTELEVVDCHCK